MASVVSLFCSRVVSVISSSRRLGARPDVARALTTVWTSPALRNWTGDRLTAIFTSLGQRAAVVHACVHGRFEEAEGAAPIRFGAIERQICVAHQLVRRGAVGRTDRNADAGADDDLVAIDLVGLAHDFDDTPRQRAGVRG